MLFSYTCIIKVKNYVWNNSFRDGEGDFQFNSDRSTEEMVHFAKRLARPPVQEVTDDKDIEMLKQTHKNFFMFIGKSVSHTWVLRIKLKLFAQV